MIERIPGWTPHCERSLKEVLCSFLEELHCTKSAFSLRTPAGGFQLAVRCGIGRGDAQPPALEPDDPMVIAAGDLAGAALVVNRVDELPRLEQRPRAAEVQRMVLAAAVDGGRLIGGVEIPGLARMVHAVEVYDVLTSRSSYLAPIPPEQALATLASGKGAQFDPEMVELLARVVA